jgi:hypothetical protein
MVPEDTEIEDQRLANLVELALRAEARDTKGALIPHPSFPNMFLADAFKEERPTLKGERLLDLEAEAGTSLIVGSATL